MLITYEVFEEMSQSINVLESLQEDKEVRPLLDEMKQQRDTKGLKDNYNRVIEILRNRDSDKASSLKEKVDTFLP